MCAAIVDGKPVINLPGPFLAAYHGLEWCVNAVVSHYLNQPKQRRQILKATLTKELNGNNIVSMYMPFEVTRKNDGTGYLASPCNFKQMPMWRCIAANAQYMTKLGEHIPAGGDIEIELLRGLEYIPVYE